jgi:potassium-transporting ATPase KdpC subunit
MKNIVSEIRIAVVATVFLAVIVCGIYPLAVWGVSQALFSNKANGSLIVRDGKTLGSKLLAQKFTDPKYFHPRPSSAGEVGYDGGSSGGSNLGPISQKLMDAVKERTDAYRVENDLPPSIPVPADAVTASASGLDPHISVKNAMLQAKRVSRERAMSEEAVLSAINSHTQARDLGILGEPRVNLLTLNLSLDAR